MYEFLLYEIWGSHGFKDTDYGLGYGIVWSCRWLTTWHHNPKTTINKSFYYLTNSTIIKIFYYLRTTYWVISWAESWEADSIAASEEILWMVTMFTKLWDGIAWKFLYFT
jgi:hypothetical protein